MSFVSFFPWISLFNWGVCCLFVAKPLWFFCFPLWLVRYFENSHLRACALPAVSGRVRLELGKNLKGQCMTFFSFSFRIFVLALMSCMNALCTSPPPLSIKELCEWSASEVILRLLSVHGWGRVLASANGRPIRTVCPVQI